VRRRLSEVVTGIAFLALLVVGVLYVRSSSSDSVTVPIGGPAGSSSAAPSPSASPTPSPTPSPAPTRSSSATPGPRRPVIGDPLSSALATSVKPPTTSTPLPPPALDFTLATFNVLGASHTASGGTKAGRPSGRVRARWAAQLIARHRADVVGFQELQGSQLAVLQRSTNLEFYPGFSLGRLSSENSIGWRRDLWEAVQRRTVEIPYFNGGLRAMPVVLLRSRQTGLEAWFTNFHNPAETGRFHHQQRFRTRATAIEARVADTLIATKLPVFITGDMNERAAYFCRLTSRTPMIAARGGSNTGGRCQAGRSRAIDWILGSPGVRFSDYTEDRSHLVDITTDHPVVSARVRITGTAAVR